MARNSRKRNPLIIILITVVGLLFGSLLSLIIDTLLGFVSGDGGSVLGIFTWSVPIGFDLKDVGIPEVIQFSFGLNLNINAMSFLGLWLAHRFYKSYQ